ncbi:MAG: alpha/beta hydrolase [Spirochaetales bacterium]|jgi:pimeloyl-ACP methyl ester carboxylesterase|nr:alpha/beta hydrolase [Spirochaetales bacterium]
MRRIGRKLLRIVLWVFAAIVFLLLISSMVHATYFRQRFENIEPYGELVEVFDGSMHLYSVGEGEKTIVLLPGMGVGLPSADFGPLMRALGEKYTVVVVEYFGVGFSSTTERPRSSANYVEEIRTALATAGFRGPYVLMGHSISSAYSELYASLHPEEVEAIISLDGTSTALSAPMPAFAKALLPIARVQQDLGLTSLLGPLVTNADAIGSLGYTTQEIQDMLVFAGFSVNRTLLAQMGNVSESIEEVMRVPFPPQVPYLKLIASDTYEKPNPMLPVTPIEYQLQHLERIGGHAQYKVLEGTHFLYQTNVDKIVQLTDLFLASRL